MRVQVSFLVLQKPVKIGGWSILYMEEKQTIVVLGTGSITKRACPDGRIERCDNVSEVDLYIEIIDEMMESKRRLWVEVYLMVMIRLMILH